MNALFNNFFSRILLFSVRASFTVIVFLICVFVVDEVKYTHLVIDVNATIYLFPHGISLAILFMGSISSFFGEQARMFHIFTSNKLKRRMVFFKCIYLSTFTLSVRDLRIRLFYLFFFL